MPGVAALVAGLFLAVEAAGLALFAFVRIWMEGRRGLGMAIRGLVLALAHPRLSRLFRRPRADPAAAQRHLDRHRRSARLLALARRARGARRPHPAGRGAGGARASSARPIRRSRRSPSICRPRRPSTSSARPRQSRGWQVIEAARPGGRVGLGRLEAVDRTFLLRLPDDITVRIRPRADGARIDVRSASRIGKHDLGQNAQRIQRFLEEVSNLAIAVQ